MNDIPINYETFVDEFLSKNEEKYLVPVFNQILDENNITSIPTLILDLQDLEFNELLPLFREDPKQFISYFQKGLYKKITDNSDLKVLYNLLKIESEDLHIIPDATNLENIISRITDLTINKNKFVEKFIIIEGRYMTMGLEKNIRFTTIQYQCNECGTTFYKNYSQTIDKRIFGAKFCFKKKCENKTDFEIISSESYEIGNFIIDHLDFDKSGNYFNCYILNHIDFFLEKIKEINLGEEVEVLGILRVNYSALSTKKEKQRFDYYLEVYDIKPKKTKFLDYTIIKKLEEKLQNNSSYLEKLIDSIHPLTYLIDSYYPIKLNHAITFITGGSWNNQDHIRDTLNSIVAGAKSTYKSSIARSFESIIGKKEFLVYEVNKDITKAGLIGTTQRDSNTLTPIIRYGILHLFSDGTIVFDENQKNKEEILDILRCLEAGHTGVLQDAILFSGSAKESIMICQNFIINNDGSYNFDKNLFENLGWNNKNSESRLERFDLLYIIPISDAFTQLRILDNEEEISKGILIKRMDKDLELEDYEFPKEIISIRKKIDYLLYQYFHYAKILYRKIILSEENKNELRNLYRTALLSKEDKFKADTDINIRSLNICYKLLKALSSLRFSLNVENTSFNYFRKECMKLIIPFRDSELINTRQIDMDSIFKEVFISIVSKEITIKDFIDHIRAYIKRIYYNDKSDDIFEEEIKDYIGSEYTLKNNYEFNKLFKNNEDWINEKGYFIESQRGRGKLATLKPFPNKDYRQISDNTKETGRFSKNDMDHIFVGQSESNIMKIEILMNRLREIAEENKWKALERKSIIQILTLEPNLDKKFIENSLNELIKEGILIEKENNFIQFKEKIKEMINK